MTTDPYKAPKAQVADVDVGPDLASRPASVTLACRLLWVTLALGVLSLVPEVRTGLWVGLEKTPGAVVFMVGFVAAMTLIEAWLIRLVARRHGWARWALLVYLIVGWLMTFSDFSVSIEQGMIAVVIDLVCGVAEMVAAGLLFLSAGRMWFHRQA
jgi:hypothetical protein